MGERFAVLSEEDINLLVEKAVPENTKKSTSYAVNVFDRLADPARLCEKYLKDNKHSSLHLSKKYARIFVLGHYLFLEAHSFPRASLSENCSLLGTDNVRGQLSVNIFALNGDYCLYIPTPLKVALCSLVK